MEFVNNELIFDLSELTIQIKGTGPTERRNVAIATKFYDPIGFVDPVIICFKMLFQELVTARLDGMNPCQVGC